MSKSNIEVLYEDNHLIILNKHPSQIVQGDKTGDTPLSDLLKQYLKEKYKKPGEVFVGVTHRIDRPVSGVCVFAKTSKALARLNEMFKNHDMHKTYYAVVKNKPKQEEGILENYLFKNEKHNKSHVTTPEKGKLAKLGYRVIKSSDRYYLLEIQLFTGRHHQIRCQLAHIGCPIKGDIKYGFDRPNPDLSIHLHAHSVEFLHPVKQELLKVIAPPPKDNLWKALLD